MAQTGVRDQADNGNERGTTSFFSYSDCPQVQFDVLACGEIQKTEIWEQVMFLSNLGDSFQHTIAKRRATYLFNTGWYQ